MPTQLEAWLGEFPREEAEARIAQLERELVRWRNALSMHDALTGRNGAAAIKEGEIPTKPQAIQMILREAHGRPMAPGEILKEMVKRKWLGDGPKFRKRFYATMSRMNREGRIVRTGDQRYILPPDLLEGAA